MGAMNDEHVEQFRQYLVTENQIKGYGTLRCLQTTAVTTFYTDNIYVLYKLSKQTICKDYLLKLNKIMTYGFCKKL